jgi:hypothetical protein
VPDQTALAHGALSLNRGELLMRERLRSLVGVLAGVVVLALFIPSIALGAACTPTTCAAEGKNCGWMYDGCGHIIFCGSCGLGQWCGANGNGNVCGSGACTPKTCLDQHSDCGDVPDSCGGTVTCGDCKSGRICTNLGQGIYGSLCSTCTPDISCKTASGAKVCNTTIPDGCGSTVTCGNTCSGTETCGPDHTCICGVMSHCAQSYNPFIWTCGPIPDGCGGYSDCGGCPVTNNQQAPPGPFYCIGNQCVPQHMDGGGNGGAGGCTPESCLDQRKNCGLTDDGCGNILNCGTCTPPDTCGYSTTDVCGHCIPQCSGKTCGSDGCGGTCGDCNDNQTCVGSVCKTTCSASTCKGGCCDAGRCQKPCR